MKNMVLATGVLATTLLAAGAALAQGPGNSYGAVYLGGNTAGSSSTLSFGGLMGYNFSSRPGAVTGIEEEVGIDTKSNWGSAGAVSGTVSGRAGYSLGQALVFGKLGLGYSSANTGYWVIGAGVDYDLSGGAFVRGEVDRADPYKAGLNSENQVKLGIGWNF